MRFYIWIELTLFVKHKNMGEFEQKLNNIKILEYGTTAKTAKKTIILCKYH